MIFTFDGDAAGQKAALKVFGGDQNFISQTYVAVEPSGLDPCDLRLQNGDAAVRELVGRRVPLYQFVMANVLRGYDLDRADGRLGALREAAGLIGSIRDSSLVGQYLRELAGMLGMDIEEVRREVSVQQRRARGRGGDDPEPEPEQQEVDVNWPNPDDPSLRLERDSLKLMLQHPMTFDAAWNGVQATDFTHPGYAAVFGVISRTPLSETWTDELRRNAGNELVIQLLVALLVEPLLRQADEAYSYAHSCRLQLARVVREISDVKSKLQRTDPVKDPTGHRNQFAHLTELEMQRKRLLHASIGD